MNDVITRFEERVIEVEKYYNVLELLNDPRVKIIKSYQRYDKTIPFEPESNKIMKSTCFLLLYNLVEATIRDSFTELYGKINLEPEIHADYNLNFQKLWLNQHFKVADPFSSNQNTYKKIVREIIDKVLNNEPFILDSKKLPISGNLNADGIRKLFKTHEIKLKVHYKALGGGELTTVKDKRNALAHGNTSFSDCGMQYSLTQLNNIKNKTIIYIRSTLRNIKKFHDNRGYAAV